jgi:hypothetical protein
MAPWATQLGPMNWHNMSTVRYDPDATMLQRRLDGGRRRAERLRLSSERLTGLELAAKLDDRRTEDDEFHCYECGVVLDSDALWHLDHVDPLALGGPHMLWNLEALCRTCNLRKGKRKASKVGWALLLTANAARPHIRLRDRTVEELWAEDLRTGRDTARQFARRPRHTTLPIREWTGKQRRTERAVVGALLRLAELDSDPNIWRARALDSLKGVGYPGKPRAPKGGALLTNYWARLMGLAYPSSEKVKGFSQFEKQRPSAWFKPVRAPHHDPMLATRYETEGFRLRFAVTRSSAYAFVLEGSEILPSTARVADVDQL